MKTCIVGISGGVDSATCLKILQESGYIVKAVHLKMLNTKNANKASLDAEKVAKDLNVDFHLIDITSEFANEVLDEFCNSYLNGNTPNPCVLCNAFVKFDALEKIRMQFGYDYLATGHYAIIQHFEDENTISDCNLGKYSSLQQPNFALYKAFDKTRDQSYFLYKISKKILHHVIFPLGNYTKDHVRKLAAEWNIHIANKNDSQDICFLDENKNYFQFINSYISSDAITKIISDSNNSHDQMRKKLQNLAGNILNESGDKLASHDCVMKFTIGQRKGLQLSDGPYYVKKIVNNDVIVSKIKYNNCETVVVSDVNWLCDSRMFNADVENDIFDGKNNCDDKKQCKNCDDKRQCKNCVHDAEDFSNFSSFFVKIRSNEGMKRAQVIKISDEILHVCVEESSVAIDQHCVVYDSAGRVLCGGRISDVMLKDKSFVVC